MLPCPRCRTPLAAGRSPAGMAWVCGSCSGRAVTMPVLRKFADREALARMWGAAHRGDGKPGCECPSCAKPTFAVVLDVEGDSLALDVCRRCQLVWFDSREIEALPRPAPAPRHDVALSPASTQAVARMQLALEKERGEDRDVSSPPDEAWKVWAGVMGMPVVIDHRLDRRPWVTWSLLAVIAIASFLGLRDVGGTLGAWGFLAWDPLANAGLRWPASVLVHSNVFHLVGNLYFLWIFGALVEDTIGRARFLALFVLSAFAGHLVHLALTRHPEVPVLGASAAISGVITFGALAMPRLRIAMALPFLWWWTWPGERWFRMSARTAFAFWIVLQLVASAFERFGPWTRTAYLEHLGGALAGLLFWLVQRRLASPAVARRA